MEEIRFNLLPNDFLSYLSTLRRAKSWLGTIDRDCSLELRSILKFRGTVVNGGMVHSDLINSTSISSKEKKEKKKKDEKMRAERGLSYYNSLRSHVILLF